MTATDPGPPETPDFQVLGPQIREDTTLGPGNAGLVTEYVVPYKITSGPAQGHQGSVRVAPEDFTPARVEQEVRDAVATVHGIAGIGQSSA